MKHLISITALLLSFSAYASEGYEPADEATFNDLKIKAEVLAEGANSVRYIKQAGRLACIQVVAKVDNVVVGYNCSLEKSGADDRVIYKALKVKEEYVGRGANSIRYEKVSGRLTCTRTVAKSDNVTVGIQCSI